MDASREAVIRTVVAAMLDVLVEPAYELTVPELISVVYSLTLRTITGVVTQYPTVAPMLSQGLYPLIAACIPESPTIH